MKRLIELRNHRLVNYNDVEINIKHGFSRGYHGYRLSINSKGRNIYKTFMEDYPTWDFQPLFNQGDSKVYPHCN